MHTFLVEMQVNGIGLARGTCLAISHKNQWFIVTNRHNVTGRDQYSGRCLSRTGGVPDQLAILMPTSDLGNYWHIHGLPLFDGKGQPTWTEHPVYGPDADVVALALNPPPQARLFGARLSDHDDFAVEVGDPVCAVGYRRGEPLFSAFPQWIQCALESPLAGTWEGLPAFLIKGPTAQGSSGSPIIAHREDAFNLKRADGSPIGAGWATRFLGVYSGRIADGVGIVWNFNCVREIVDRALKTTTSEVEI